jgi:hypothetical protein
VSEDGLIDVNGSGSVVTALTMSLRSHIVKRLILIPGDSGLTLAVDVLRPRLVEQELFDTKNSSLFEYFILTPIVMNDQRSPHHKQNVGFHLSSTHNWFFVFNFSSLKGSDHGLLTLFIHASDEFIKVNVVLLVVFDMLQVGAIARREGYCLVKLTLIHIPKHSLESFPSNHLDDFSNL